MESRRFLFLLFGSTGGLVSGWLFCTIMLPVLPCSLATLTSRWGHPLGATRWGRWMARSPTIDSARVWAGRSNLLSCTKLMSSTRVHLIEIWGTQTWPTERTFPLPGDSAEIPTVTRDIIYGWARGLVGPLLLECFSPTTFVHKAANTTGKKSGTGWESSIFFWIDNG